MTAAGTPMAGDTKGKGGKSLMTANATKSKKRKGQDEDASCVTANTHGGDSTEKMLDTKKRESVIMADAYDKALEEKKKKKERDLIKVDVNAEDTPGGATAKQKGKKGAGAKAKAKMKTQKTFGGGRTGSFGSNLGEDSVRIEGSPMNVDHEHDGQA